MSLPYRRFASYVLGDRAERSDPEWRDRVTFSGNHVSRQFVAPVRGNNETPTAYATRLQDFHKRLPRHSDLSMRLALALEALIRSGEKQWAAASFILGELRESSQRSREQRLAYAQLGIPHKEFDVGLGNTRRGRRGKRKRRGFTRTDRFVETIRAQALRFKRMHKDFDRLFENEIGSFRFSFARDVEWYAQAEARYEAWLRQFESRQGAIDWWTAMPIAVLAELYHEQMKHDQARVCYRKALQAARRAIMHEDFRKFILGQLRIRVKACSKGTHQLPPMEYRGPGLPVEQSEAH